MKYINKIVGCKKIGPFLSNKVTSLVVLLMLYKPVFADGSDDLPIPMTDDDKIQTGKSVFTPLLNILKEALPFIEVIISIGFIIGCVMTVMSGLKDSKNEKHEAGALKQSIINASLLLIFGGFFVYLLYRIQILIPNVEV